MIPRYILAAVLGGTVTFGLFYLMQALISMADARPGDERGGKVIEFVRLKREETVQEKQREIPDKLKPPEAPPPPPMNFNSSDRPNSDSSGFAQSFGDFTADMGDGPALGVGGGDSDSIPLVRPQPTYPIRAAERGIEGWVEIVFTITPRGTIEDPKVVGYEPSTIFNNSALRAIRRWKYNPKIVNGKPVSRREKVRLLFTLDNV